MGDDSNNTDQFVLPERALSGCVYGVILRDTTGRGLNHRQRFNHFPASPLCAVSLFFEGESFEVTSGEIARCPLPRLTFTGPARKPVTSWNPGPVRALSVGFFPEAWLALDGQGGARYLDNARRLEDVTGAPMLDLCREALATDDLHLGWQRLQEGMADIWHVSRPATFTPYSLSDWSRNLAIRAANSDLGRSLRQVQRRINFWTGQNKRALESYGRVEALHRFSQNTRDLAELALEAGYADQSHMGRELRAVTGQSPARLRTLIATEEAFWVYRLIGENL